MPRMVVSAAAVLALLGTSPALAQQAAPSLPPLPRSPGQDAAPSLPPLPGAPKGPPATMPAVVPVDTGDSNPAPACSTPMIVDKVFDFSSRQVQDAYHRSLYGKVLNVAESESRGTRRKCSGEMSDSDGWTYPVTYVIEKQSADQVQISYDFSRVKPPPKLVVAPEPVVPPSALPPAPTAPSGPPRATPAPLGR